MAQRKDYYKILGITEEEKKLPWEEFSKIVKRKYRKLSLEHHPDRHQDDDEQTRQKAEETFKNIAEAYAVLSDQDKKQKYDNPTSGFSFNFNGFDPFAGFDPFRDFNPFGTPRRENQKRQEVGNSIRIEIPLTLEEIYNGIEKKIKYRRQEPCDKCHGTGLGENGHMEDCPVCGGPGMEYTTNGMFHQMSTCRHCKGKGKIASSTCSECNGSGFKIVEHEVTINIPKGIMPGAQITLTGEGCLPLSKDGIPGDLLVMIAEKPNDVFMRRENDLIFELKVPIITAILGGKMNVSTIDGKILSATIPSGSEEGKNIRFAGKGMPVFGKEDKFGSMIGIIRLELPKELNEEEKRLLNELKEQEHFKTI